MQTTQRIWNIGRHARKASILALLAIAMTAIVACQLPWQGSTESTCFSIDGVFEIMNRASGKVLDVPNGAQGDGVQIIQYTAHGSQNQHWHFVSVDGDYFEIVNEASGKVLDVPDGAQGDGVQIIQYTAHGSQNQHWQLIEVS
jgi:hypothetical protein